MMRAAVLYDERDRKLGQAMVPDSTLVIEHDGRFFFRAQQGVRLTGGGIGAKFVDMEPVVRNTLPPAGPPQRTKNCAPRLSPPAMAMRSNGRRTSRRRRRQKNSPARRFG